MGEKFKTYAATLVVFIAGTVGMAGVANISGVPFCSMINTCENNLYDENLRLIAELQDANLKIKNLNEQNKASTAEIQKYIKEAQDRNKALTELSKKLDLSNLQGIKQDEKIVILTKKIKIAAVGLLALFDAE